MDRFTCWWCLVIAMPIKKNVMQTSGVDSNCKNVHLITARMETAAWRAHCANGGWSKSTQPAFYTFLLIVFSTCYENGSCLPVLMAWDNREVNGEIAGRMNKYNTYLCQSMLGLDPKAHFLLGIGDVSQTLMVGLFWCCGGASYSGGNKSPNWDAGNWISTPL